MWREECSYRKSAYSEVIKLQASNFYHTEEKFKVLFMLHILSMYKCAHLPTGVRDDGDLAFLLKVTWVLPLFFSWTSLNTFEYTEHTKHIMFLPSTTVHVLRAAVDWLIFSLQCVF
jgi:hypothetical protein